MKKEIIQQYLGSIQTAINNLDAKTKAAYNDALAAFLSAEKATDEEFDKLDAGLKDLINNTITDAQKVADTVKDNIINTLDAIKEDNQHVQTWIERIRNSIEGHLMEWAEKISNFWRNVAMYFQSHMSVDELYFTADHQCFFNLVDAQNHAQALNKAWKTPEALHITLVRRGEQPQEIPGVAAIPAQPQDETPKADNTTDPGQTDEVTTDGEKHIVTQADLDLNPELVEQGVKVGDEIVLGPNVQLTPEEEQEELAKAKAKKK